MEPNIHSVAIITKRDSSEADSAAIKVATLLNRSKIKVHSVAPFIIEDATPIRPDQLKDMKLDLVFAIGETVPPYELFVPYQEKFHSLA